jgi:hypothetical protein
MVTFSDGLKISLVSGVKRAWREPFDFYPKALFGFAFSVPLIGRQKAGRISRKRRYKEMEVNKELRATYPV